MSVRDPRDVLLAPVISEKSYGLIDEGKYTFLVDPRSNKTEIKLAVEKHLNHDASCGNKQWFNPLTAVDHAEMGTTDENEFSGPSLCTKWSDPNKRSSFFGTFSY